MVRHTGKMPIQHKIIIVYYLLCATAPDRISERKNEEEEELRFVSNGHLYACDVDPISMNVCECVCISGLFH